MFWLIALIMILLGLYLIFSGLRDRGFQTEEVEIFDDEYRLRRRYEVERGYRRELKELKEEIEWEENERPSKKVTGGGVILIGPIPIVFGESRFAVLALILSIVLMLLSIFMLFSFR